MTEQQTFIAVKSAALSKPHDERYVIIDRQTGELKDDGLGHGYRSPQAAHRSFAYKQKFAGRVTPHRSNYPFKQK